MTPATDKPCAASPPHDGGRVSAKVLVPQAIERRWSFVLSLHERVLLMRLQDMTVQWNRESVEATMRQIVDGRAGQGEAALGPIGFGRTAADKALAGLVDRGLVTSEKSVDPRTGAWTGQCFTVNVELIVSPWENNMPPHIATPKRLKSELPASREGGSREASTPFPSGEYPLPATREHNTSTYTNNFYEEGAKAPGEAKATPPAEPGLLFADGTQEIVSKINSNGPAKKSEGITSARGSVEKVRAEKAARLATALQAATERVNRSRPVPAGMKTCTQPGVIRASDLEIVWRGAWAEAFRGTDEPGVWSKIERGQAMTLFSRWPRREDGTHPNGTFGEFLLWSVSNWKHVTGKLNKLKEAAPALPRIGFLLGFFDRFQNEFLTDNRRKVLTRLDIDEVDELVAKGHSHDAALEIIARRKVTKAAARVLPQAAPKATPAPILPVARPRTKPQNLQPVATESGLPSESAKPTNVLGSNRRSAASYEEELWGSKKSTEFPE